MTPKHQERVPGDRVASRLVAAALRLAAAEHDDPGPVDTNADERMRQYARETLEFHNAAMAYGKAFGLK